MERNHEIYLFLKLMLWKAALKIKNMKSEPNKVNSTK